MSADLVTSGGHHRVAEESDDSTRMLPLSAWSGNEMKNGPKVLRGVKTACANEIIDLVAGKSRPTLKH